MTYYVYVKSGYGTRGTGSATPFTSAQSGAFSSLTAGDVYPDIDTALTANSGVLSVGDQILCSDAHSKSYSQTLNWNFYDALCTSVSDSACDTYSKGAAESTGSGSFYDMNLSNAILVGMDLTAADDIGLNSVVAYDCDFTLGSDQVSGAGFYTQNAAESATINGGTITFSNAGFISAGSYRQVFTLLGVQVSGTASSTVLQINSYATDLRFFGGSLPTCTTLAAINSGHNNSRILMRNVDVDYTNICSLPTGYASSIDIDGCYSSNIPVHRGNFTPEGYMQTDTGTYRNSGASDGTNSFSARITTTASCSAANPYRLFLGAVRLDASSTKEVTIQLLHDSVGSSSGNLTDAEVWADLIYQDDLTTEGFRVSSFPADILNPSALASSAATWTEALSTEVEQKITLSTSGATGKEAVAEIWLTVTTPSITIYACPLFDVAAP